MEKGLCILDKKYCSIFQFHTQIRICTTGKFPIAAAKWSAVRKSRSLTVEFTSATLLCSKVTTIDRMSDLEVEKKRRWILLNFENVWCFQRIYLTTLSIKSFPGGTDRLISEIKSFDSYFRLIQDSFSSLFDCEVGFTSPWIFASYTEFDRVFPIESITLKCDAWSSSSPRDRTLLMCEPKFRWIPEHSMHMRIPKLHVEMTYFVLLTDKRIE